MSNNAEDDDGLFDEDDDDSSDEEIAVKKSKKRKAPSGGAGSKKSKPSWIDDAAEESGDEGGDDDDDEEDDDENENDYIKDGFVVDEDDEDVEDKKKKKKKEVGDLEDSDDDDNDDDDDDDDDSDDGKAKKKKKFRKVRQLDMLAEEDLDLIRESQATKDAQRERQEVVQQKVRARNEEELQKGLFYDSAEEDDGGAIQPSRAKGRQIERYDEDGMDDFIDDDIGDQGQILAAERRNFDEEGVRGISEAQLNEASEIFGTEYLDFMAQDEENADDEEEDLFGKGKYRERGVGVDLGVDSEEDLSEDDDEDEDDEDDDLFGDDDAGDGLQAKQKAEALKLKRQKRELARQERRQQKEHLKTEKRKAQLRRAFEPVQLVENFCTDRDDEIRNTDAPERFFDWKTPFHGSMEGGDTITDEEEEEVIWIMGRIPEIKAEYSLASRDEDRREDLENAITSSIAHALRFLHKDKFEPAFIKRYRKDVVTSPAVRENLYNIMDEDAEWDTLTQARSKVGNLLENIATEIQTVEAAGAEAESVVTLEQDLAQAIEKLEEVAHQESVLKDEIEALGPIEEDKGDDDDDDDDELFGDDDDDDVSLSC